jgi:hypothetical protein
VTHTFGAYLALVSTQPSPLMKLYVKGRSDLILEDVSGSLGPPENANFSYGWLLMIGVGQLID